MNEGLKPLRLLPAGKGYIWGGERLKKEYNKSELEVSPLAESWECSVHPDGLSVVSSGEYKGSTLKEVLETGANDVYVVGREGQKDLLLPAISQCILDVQPEEGFITVHIMEGLEDL